jgi:hypothetical protein
MLVTEAVGLAMSMLQVTAVSYLVPGSSWLSPSQDLLLLLILLRHLLSAAKQKIRPRNFKLGLLSDHISIKIGL